MIKRIVAIVFSLIVSAAFFFWLVWYTGNDSQSSLSGLLLFLGIDPFSDHLAAGLIFAASSLLLFANLVQISCNRFFGPFFKVEFALYVVALAAVLFLKSVGVQEWNIDPSALIPQLLLSPFSVLLNVVLFVPLGSAAVLLFRKEWCAFAAAFLLVVAVEVTQYLFSLGIADIVDVLLNMTGFSIGYLSVDLCKESGVRMVRAEARRWWRIARERPEGSCRSLKKKRVICVALLAIFSCFVFFGTALLRL